MYIVTTAGAYMNNYQTQSVDSFYLDHGLDVDVPDGVGVLAHGFLFRRPRRKGDPRLHKAAAACHLTVRTGLHVYCYYCMLLRI